MLESQYVSLPILTELTKDANWEDELTATIACCACFIPLYHGLPNVKGDAVDSEVQDRVSELGLGYALWVQYLVELHNYAEDILSIVEHITEIRSGNDRKFSISAEHSGRIKLKLNEPPCLVTNIPSKQFPEIAQLIKSSISQLIHLHWRPT